MPDYIKIAAYMKRKIKALKYMQCDDLLAWLAWHGIRRSLAYVIEDGEVRSAGVARPLYCPSYRLDHYEFNEGAEYVYADQASSEDAKSFAQLIQTMCNRFPYAKTFMYKHHKTGKLREWDMKRFLHHTLMKANQLERVG